jgi:DNA polymerase V
MKYVGLADCNNFFVSCERVFRPDLWGKPVVVLSSNDGAIVARSEEVKKLGVPMGVPFFKVRDIFTENKVAVFSSNFDLYQDMSRRVMKVLEEELGEIEQYSVDESFFELSIKNETTARAELARLRKIVQKNVGIPMSFGLAPTKTIAKFASEKDKRGSGVCVLSKKEWLALTPEVPLSELWGVGGKMSQKFNAQGLKSVADLLAADPSRISKIYGVYGARLLAEVSGQRAKDRDQDSLPKSIMSTRAFAKTTTSFAVLSDALAYHIAKAAEELREHDAIAGKISVMILTSRHSDWMLHGGSQEVILPQPTSDTTVLLKEALRAAKNTFEPNVPYKKAGIVLGAIKPKTFQQPDLFTESADDNNELMDTIDKLNRRWNGAVNIGRAENKKSWTNRHDHRSMRYTTSWSELPFVH